MLQPVNGALFHGIAPRQTWSALGRLPVGGGIEEQPSPRGELVEQHLHPSLDIMGTIKYVYRMLSERSVLGSAILKIAAGPNP